MMQKWSGHFISVLSIFYISFFCGVLLRANPVPSGSGLSIVSGPVAIAIPGSYRLANDISGTVTINADNVEIDLNNKKITNPSGDGISVTSHYGITIKNGIIEDASLDGIFIDTCSVIEIADIDFIGNNQGLRINSCFQVLVENCNFVGQTASANPFTLTYAGALVIDSSNNVLVRENEFSNNTNCFGISIINSSIKNRIEKNTCNQNQTGIYLDSGCSFNDIIDNKCKQNSAASIRYSGSGIYLVSSCSNNVISGNTCSGNSANAGASSATDGGSGIYLVSSCSNNVISGNTCTDNSANASATAGASRGGCGIYLVNSCSGNVISGNTCSGNSANASTLDANDGGCGISLFTCSKNVISGNTCSSNSANASAGYATDGGCGIRLRSSSSENVVDGNTCSNNSSSESGGGSAIAGGSGIFVDNNSDTNTIQENTCNDHITGPTNTGYGIRINESSCDNNVVCRNKNFRNTTGISDAGTGTVSYNNALVDIGATILTLS